MINSHKQKGDTSNEKNQISRCNISIVLHALNGSCGSTQNGQETQSESPAYSQGEMPGGNKGADAEKGKEEYLEI